VTDERVTIELDLTQPLLEWIELEADDDQTTEEWIKHAIRYRLDAEFLHERIPGDVEVAVPQHILKRVSLKYQDQLARGDDPSIDELLFNHVTYDVTWTTEHGNPINWTTNDGE
jgi:hypothetical protein